MNSESADHQLGDRVQSEPQLLICEKGPAALPHENGVGIKWDTLPSAWHSATPLPSPSGHMTLGLCRFLAPAWPARVPPPGSGRSCAGVCPWSFPLLSPPLCVLRCFHGFPVAETRHDQAPGLCSWKYCQVELRGRRGEVREKRKLPPVCKAELM